MATPASTTALRLPGNLDFGAGGVAVDFLTGAFVKSAIPTSDGTGLVIVLQNAAGAEATATWTPPSGGTGTGLTAEQARDTIADILTEGDGVTIAYVDDGDNAGTITISATLALSDTAPRSVSTGVNAAGTATDAARRDHHHQVPAATTTQAGISEHATAAETRTGTSTTRTVTPSALTAGLDNRASDDAPVAPASTAAAGSSTDFSRSDHRHVEGGDGTVLNGNGAPAGNSGKDGDTYRDDETGDWYKKSAGVWSSALYTPPLLSDADPLASGTASAGASALTSRSDHVHPAGTGEGADLSDDLPVNIGPQSQQGTGDEASRDDHTHYLPHDATLGFSDGALGVSIHDVVEHLSQRIQYYTNENNYSTEGSGAGQVYDTSRYPKNLQWVKAFIRVPLGVDDALYRAGAYRVDSDNEILEVLGQSETSGIITVTGTYRFDFLAEDTSALGIPLEGGERVMVLIRRIGAGDTADTGLRHGSEDDDSPNASYPDAAVDFVLANHVIVQHENPGIGQTTHSHGGGIRGNLQLGYIVIIDHGSLVGDPGNINVSHISSGAATDGQVATADGAGGTAWEDAAAGGGAGTDPETLFDNHPTLVQIGTLSANLASTPTSLTLAALPTETVNTADFLLINSEVIDLSIVNGLTLSGIRGQRGTDAAVHLGGTPVYLLTTANGGLGRTLTTRSWVYGGSNQNAFDLGKALTEAADDGKECIIEVEYDSNDARRYGSITIGAQTLRELRSLARISTSTTHETFPLVMQRVDQTNLTTNAPMFLHFGRKRFDATDATNFSVTSGNDGLRLAVSAGGSAALMYRFYMRVSLVAPGGGASGQESPESGSGFGGELIILYQRVANESRPADPPAAYSAGAYVTDFGDWVDDIGDLTGTGFDWVATGGTAEDADGAIVNRTWALQAYIAVQYAEVIQDNDTYTDAAETGSRFVRHRLTDGSWGPWVPLSVTDWVPVVSDHNGYVIEDTTVSTGTINFDATYFTEMRVTVYTFGAFDAGVPINLGVRGSAIATRWGSYWTGLDTSNATLGFGSYKLRLDDKQGLDIVQLSDNARGDLQSDQQNNDGDEPNPRASCRMDVVGRTINGVLQRNIIGHITWRDHPSYTNRTRITVEMR